MIDTISPEEANAVDFAIVTALPIERDAMLAHLEDVQQVRIAGAAHDYFRGQISIPGTQQAYQVVLLLLSAPGNVHAAAGATAVIQRWSPSHVLMVGIAGGVAPNQVQLGDVVVANYVYYYEPGKQMPAGEQRRGREFPCDTLLWSRARNYMATDWKEAIQIQPPMQPGFVPTVHFGPIASGEQVVADTTYRDQLLQEDSKLLAIAMEGAGVGVAAAHSGGRFLEVRGVSDLADSEKNDSWHQYAADAAAAFVSGFLRSAPVTLQELPTVDQHTNSHGGMPLSILRAQSLRKIQPDELLPALPDALQQRDYQTVPLDFTDLSSQSTLLQPEAAVARLLDRNGALLNVLEQRDATELVFHGLIAIPLALLIGYLVTDRQPVHLMDYHPDQRSWIWPDDIPVPPPLTVRGLPPAPIHDRGEVVVRVSVTFTVHPESTIPVVPAPIAAIDVAVPSVGRNLIRSAAQVHAYGQSFRQVLDDIVRLVPNAARVHVFYAGPVSLAFHLGQQISENIHQPVVVWDYNRGYTWGIDLSRLTTEAGAVVRAPNALLAPTTVGTASAASNAGQGCQAAHTPVTSPFPGATSLSADDDEEQHIAEAVHP